VTETKRYCVYMIPVAYKAAADVAMALLNGDNPATSRPFGQGANADGVPGPDPETPFSTATHFFGGMWAHGETGAAWLDAVSNLATNMVAGDWPVQGVTEAEAMTAASFMTLQVSVTQNGQAPNTFETLFAILNVMNLVKIIPIEE